MKKLFYFLFLLIFVNLAAKAQQDPQFSFNKVTQLTVNPGYAGSNDALTGLILNRYQWSSFEGAPKTLLFSVETTTNIFGGKSGVGLNIISDELGLEKNILVNFNYSYHKTTNLGNLGIGVSFGLFNKSITSDWNLDNTVPNGWQYTSASDDPWIPTEDVSQVTFDSGLGLYLKSNDYFASFSVTHINEGKIRYGGSDAYFALARHYYLSGGYNISLNNPLFQLRPAIFIKSDLVGLASSQVDFNVNLVYKEIFTGGLNYRLDDAITLLVGVEMKNGLNLGVAYDITTSAIGRYGFGSQEIYLRYALDLSKGRQKKYKSIRFL